MKIGDVTEDNLESISIYLDLVQDRDIDEGDSAKGIVPSIGWWSPSSNVTVGPYVTFHSYRKNGEQCIFRIWQDGRTTSGHHQSSTRRHKSISTSMHLWWVWTDSGHKVEELPTYSVMNALPSPSDEDWVLRRTVQAYSEVWHLFREPTITIKGRVVVQHHN